MKKVIFNIWTIDDSMCRITTNNARTDIRKLSDGGCICDIETLLDEMNRIRDEASVLGYDVTFYIIDGR